MKGVVISMLVVFSLVQLMMVKPSEAAVSCADVDSSLASCVGYLTAGTGAPSDACCAGVKKITTIAQTTVDRRAACDCLKAAASRIPNIKEDAASSLPQKCDVTMNIPISKNTNCANIN